MQWSTSWCVGTCEPKLSVICKAVLLLTWALMPWVLMHRPRVVQGHKASIAIAIFQLLNLVLSDIGALPAPAAAGLLLPPLLCTFEASLGCARSKGRELFTEGRHSGQVPGFGGCKSQAGGEEAGKGEAGTMSRQAGH